MFSNASGPPVTVSRFSHQAKARPPKLFEPRRQLYRSDVFIPVERLSAQTGNRVGFAIVRDYVGDNDRAGGSGSTGKFRCTIIVDCVIPAIDGRIAVEIFC